MNIIESNQRLCFGCLQEHLVHTVIERETHEFKGVEITYDAQYDYCDQTEELLEVGEMIQTNSLAMKDAYREKVGLLTSEEIKAIREKYGVSQKDFSEILEWGKATVTRYETHQVQDKAHDEVLRKLDSDPEWFLELLNRAKNRLSNKAYNKYFQIVAANFHQEKNRYLMSSIKAIHAGLREIFTGNRVLDLDKVIFVINYFALKMEDLSQDQLMKMLWYADNLSYKQSHRAITGLAYRLLPIGVVPEGFNLIVALDGIEKDIIETAEGQYDFIFSLDSRFQTNQLPSNEIDILDKVIATFGRLKTLDLQERMLHEEGVRRSEDNELIPFTFADSLSSI